MQYEIKELIVGCSGDINFKIKSMESDKVHDLFVPTSIKEALLAVLKQQERGIYKR